MLLRLQQLGVPVALVPLAWAGLHVVRSGSSYPGGLLADRIGARWTYLLGSAAYIATVLGLATRPGEVAAFAIFLGFGLVAGFIEPAERVAVSRLAPVRTGRGFGNYQALAGFAALPAGLGFGALYRGSGPAALVVSAAVLGLGTILWLAASRNLHAEPG